MAYLTSIMDSVLQMKSSSCSTVKLQSPQWHNAAAPPPGRLVGRQLEALARPWAAWRLLGAVLALWGPQSRPLGARPAFLEPCAGATKLLFTIFDAAGGVRCCEGGGFVVFSVAVGAVGAWLCRETTGCCYSHASL